MHHIIKLDDIILPWVKVMHPVTLGDSKIFGVKYQDMPLIIQTPYLYIKHNPLKFENGYFKLDVELAHHKKHISELETYIHQKISKKYPQFTTNFVPSDGILRTRSMNVQSVEVFDAMQTTIDISKIHLGDRVCMLIMIDNYAFNEHKSYMTYTIMQIQKFVIYANIGETTAKYIRMLAVGVPRNAVQQKMRMDGVDEDTIEVLLSSQPHSVSPSIRPPPPPPPPMPPPVVSIPGAGAGPPMAAVFQDILNGNFALKKNTKKIDSKKILKFVDTSKKVPSLEEIQNALKNLRRIK